MRQRGAQRRVPAVAPSTCASGLAATGGVGVLHLRSCPPTHSAPADEVADPYAGLTGAIVIGRKGELKDDLTAKDVDR